MNGKEETSSHKSSETVSCKSYHSDASRKDNGGGASFLELYMNIGNYKQRRTVSEPVEDIRLLQKHRTRQHQNQPGAMFDNNSIPTPPGTPQKDKMIKIASERQNLQLPDQDQPAMRQLSPLMVDTSIDMTDAQRNQHYGYPYGDYPELKSSGIFLPMERNIDARKKDKIFRAISQVLSQEEDDDEGYSKAKTRVPEPFALQDPSSFRLKRQISTESNDSGDIKFSNKSPVKRMQSVPSNNSSVKATPRLDRQPSSQSEKSKDDVIKCKPYATNLQWIVPKDGPSSEKDFVEASHMKKSYTFPSDLSFSNNSTDNSRRQSDTSMNKDMMSGFLSRRGDTFGTGTTHSSRNPMVSEKGFYFPQSPQVIEPVLFSPRIVNNTSRPIFSANDTNPVRSKQACGTNIERYGSLDSMQCENHSGTSVSEDSNFENKLVSEFFRKRALRSNSDIPRSPSKQEIEEVRELIRKYHRSLSDPSFISPQKKAMLYEEKMIDDLTTRDDVFEDPSTTSTPKYSDHRSLTPRTTSSSQDCKDEIVRELLEHNQMMRKELVKRRLYQECEDLRNPYTGSDRHYNEDIPEVSRSVETAGLLVGGLQRRTSDRKRHSTIPEDPEMSFLDRVDGGSNKSSPGNRDRFHDNERQSQPPKSPLPSTSLISPSTSQRGHGEPSRKRKRGEINLRMTCSCEDLAERSRELTERLHELDHSPGKNCKCANIENEILLMANDAYSKIRRSDDSKQALRQYQEEVNETNLTIFDSMSILCSIKALCKHGRTLEDVYPGSVVFVIRCRSVFALDDLWGMYKSGEIDKLFTKDFLTPKMKRKYGVSNVRLKVNIKVQDYWRVKKELDESESVVTLDSSFSKSDTEIVRVGSASKENFHRRSSMKKASISNIAIVHMRSQSAPQVNQPSPLQSPSWLLSPNSPVSKDRKFSFNLTPEEHSPRVVFQELNFGSPTLKKVFDFDIALSSKTSPKRKTFAEPPPWERDENMYSEDFASPKRKNFGTNLDRK